MSAAVIRAFISRNPSRKSFCIYAVLLFLTEVLIALYAPAGFIRGFVGDVLVVILLFCMVRAVVPVDSPAEKSLAQNTGEGMKRFFKLLGWRFRYCCLPLLSSLVSIGV